MSDVKTNAQLLRGRVDNISALGSEVKRNRGGVEAMCIQVQMANASLDHVCSQVWRLESQSTDPDVSKKTGGGQ